tara:strand:- start:27 stop:215 length:189 start_codon:yes stop_codon:yes gene_type:complete
MTYSSFTNYQQSDEDYQADFDYNSDNYTDENDIFSQIDSHPIVDTLSSESAAIIDSFRRRRK